MMTGVPSPHISPAIEEALEIARMVTAAPYEVPMNPGPSTKIARALIDLEEQLESMKRAAEWEQEHGGCFCRTCNEAVGASSPASSPVEAIAPDSPLGRELSRQRHEAENPATEHLSNPHHRGEVVNPATEAKQSIVCAKCGHGSFVSANLYPASDPDGAYWRAQGGVPNQESKP